VDVLDGKVHAAGKEGLRIFRLYRPGQASLRVIEPDFGCAEAGEAAQVLDAERRGLPPHAAGETPELA
jgi:hypothetical protein